MDHKYEQKITNLVDNILLNINIFKKVFANSKRKKSVIEKVYGWDSIFEPVFFNKNEENFKPNLKREDVIS